MQLETTRFGTIDPDESAIITFTQPIIGFQEFRRFVLFPEPDGSPLTWLQSIDTGELAFILLDPTSVVPDYTIKLGKMELAELAVSSPDELDIYTLLVVPQNKEDIRTNLKAPILINTTNRLGKQTILEKSDYPVQYYLNRPQTGTGGSQEVSDARTNA